MTVNRKTGKKQTKKTILNIYILGVLPLIFVRTVESVDRKSWGREWEK